MDLTRDVVDVFGYLDELVLYLQYPLSSVPLHIRPFLQSSSNVPASIARTASLCVRSSWSSRDSLRSSSSCAEITCPPVSGGLSGSI